MAAVDPTQLENDLRAIATHLSTMTRHDFSWRDLSLLSVPLALVSVIVSVIAAYHSRHTAYDHQRPLFRLTDAGVGRSHDGKYLFTLKNVGRGPGTDVRLEKPIEKKTAFVDVDKTFELLITEEQYRKEVPIELTYSDLYGRRFKTTVSYGVPNNTFELMGLKQKRVPITLVERAFSWALM